MVRHGTARQGLARFIPARLGQVRCGEAWRRPSIEGLSHENETNYDGCMDQHPATALSRSATFQPETVDEGRRTVTVSWSTGADVRRRSWEEGDFIERLSMDPSAVDLSRMNAGAPVLNSHQKDSLSNVLGVVEKAWIERGEGRAVLRFSAREDVEPIWNDIRDGIIRNVSVGYSVDQWKRLEPATREASPVLLAERWTPHEVSMVAVGADPKASIREAELHTPTVRDMSTETPKAGAEPAIQEQETETRALEAPSAPIPAASEPSADAAEVQRSLAQLKRENKILQMARAASLSDEQTRSLLDSGKPVDQVAVDVFTMIRDTQMSNAPAGHPARGISVTRDEGETIERGIKDALSYRLHTISEPTDFGRKFMRRRSVDLLESYLVSRGVNTDHLTPGQIIDRAFHSTSDFPNILADVANKRLLAGYAEEPQTFKPFCTQRNLADFKPHNNVQLQGKLTLTKTLEGGEYTGMTLVEGKSTWQLATYTGKLLWTRQMIINDDLGAFESVIMKAGRGARTTESDIVWDLLTTGSITGGQTYGGGATTGIDGAALFAQAHANTGAGVIGTTGANTGRTAMGKQKDIAGNSLNLMPAYVLVPTSLATTAEQYFFAPNYTPAAAVGDTGPNVFAGRMQVIVENRLETDSSAVWYMVADPRRIETIEYGYLAGEEGPQISVTDRRDPDGAEMLVRMDFGAAVQDFRGFYRSTGA